MTKTINLLGHEVGVTFNMAVEIAYETITNTPFSTIDMTSVRNQYALCMAAISACKDNANLPADFTERILSDARREDIQTLVEAVTECMTDFLHIPEPMKTDEDRQTPNDNEQEEQRKNA